MTAVIAGCSGQPTDDLDTFIAIFNVTGVQGGSDTTSDGYLTGGLNPTIEWSALNGVPSYSVKIRDAGNTADVCAFETTSSTTYAMSSCTLTEGSTYAVFLQGNGDGGAIEASNNLYAFTVDTVEPTTSITSNPADPDSDTTPTFQFSSSDATSGVAKYQCRIDSGSWYTCSANHTTGTLAAGSRTLEVRAVDNAGNVDSSPSSYTWTVVVPPGSFSITGAQGGADTTSDAYLTSGNLVTPHWGASTDATSYDVTIRNSSDTADVCATQNTASTSYNFSACPLVEGTNYKIKVTAIEPLLSLTTNASNNGLNFIVDTLPPNTTIDSNPPHPDNDTTPQFTFSGVDTGSGVASFECQINSGGFSPCTSPYTVSPALGEGSNTFEVRAIDNAGFTDATPATYVWTIDTTGPGAFDVSGVRGGTDVTSDQYLTNGNNPHVFWTTSAGASTYDVTIRNSGDTSDVCATQNTGGTDFNFGSCNLAEGTSYLIKVEALDGLGNPTNATTYPYSFSVDTTEPNTSIDSQPNDPDNDNTPTFTFSGTDATSGVASFECQINGGGYSACTSPHTVSPSIGDGSNTFEVRAIDNAGFTDSTSASYTWTVDTAAPAQPTFSGVSPGSPSSKDNPTFSGNAENNASIRIFDDAICSSEVATGTADGAGAFSIQFTVPKDVSKTYYATATDAATNESTCSVSTQVYEAYSIGVGLGYFTGTQTASGTNLNQAVDDIQFSTSRYDYDFYSHSTVTNTDIITVTQPGDYFISVTLPLDGTISRGVIRSEVKVNGAVVQGSRSESSYIRNTSGHNESSNHLAMLLSGLSASDTIEVSVEQQALAGTINLTGQATVYLENVAASRTLFSATGTQTTNSTNLNQGTAYDIQWTEDVKDTGFTHSNSTNSEQITLDTTGDYLIFVNIPLTSTGTRPNVKLQVTVNGTPIPGGSGSQGYIRNANGHNDASIHFSGMAASVTGGSILRVSVAQEAAGGTVTVPAGQSASLFVERVDTTNNVFFSRGTDLVGGTNWNPTSKDQVKWENDDIIDTTHFTHSTSVNAHQVEVETAGDYLLIYNDSLTATGQRPSPRITVEVNGTPVSGAETKAHYIRNSSSHTEASGSLVFLLRNLSPDDLITVSAQQEALAGTVDDNDDAQLVLIRKP